ncbi:sensor histidine kinase [Gilvimarinus algae]|uniref:Histidine kinase n=1 Tax=Gilvimarinus algae TaxID=3058037 RepID=A0ABT8TGA4_9GAMM|nr:histidine kinase [Gilvimarinus sp. SDUM040014]MDO3383117.1 histidine kinase [Gilvimarinus sp. SDUM040014]
MRQAGPEDSTEHIASGPPRASLLPNLCSVNALFLLVVVAELLAVLLVVTDQGLAGLSWVQLGLVSFLVQWVVLACAAVLCFLRPYLLRFSPMVAGVFSYLLVLLCTALFSVAGQWFLKGLGRGFIDWWQVATHLVIAAILAGILLRYLYLQQQLYWQQQAELRARIQALQSRIEPHFLFNSMNSIASLIAVEPDLAERQVEDLSDLLRAALAESALVSAERELELCRSYTHIEQARLGERLQVIWQVGAIPPRAVLPSLVLQPLVENAIYHGVEPSARGGQVRLSAHCDEKTLTIQIDNTLPEAPQPSRRRGNRMALDNVRHRLAAHFGSDCTLAFDRSEDSFTVKITLALTACERARKNESER